MKKTLHCSSTKINTSAYVLVFILITMLSAPSSGLFAQSYSGTAPIISLDGGFNIDGKMYSNGKGDWLKGTPSSTNYLLLDDGTPRDILSTFHIVDRFATLDNVFEAGQKLNDNPNNIIWENQSANDKTDMNHVLFHITEDLNGNKWVVFSGDRLAGNGDAYLDFEFLQNRMTMNNNFTFSSEGPHGGRTVGDFILTVNFGNGSATFDLWQWKLEQGIYQYVQYTGSLQGFGYMDYNKTSTSTPYSVFGGNTYIKNTFVEGAINLSALISEAIPCTKIGFKTLFVKTKTSNSTTATISDFVAPIQIPDLDFGNIDAGDDITECQEGAFNTFNLQGTAVGTDEFTVISHTWSVISYNGTQAPQIIDPNSLNTEVKVYNGTATLRLSVVNSDGNDNCTMTDDIVLTVNNSPAPVFIDKPAADITITCAEASSLQASALSYSNSDINCPINGSVGGVITGTFDNCGGELTQTWTFTDDLGRTITHIQNITVLPAAIPSFINVPANKEITCAEANEFSSSKLSYSNSGSQTCLIAGEVDGVITGSFTECGGTLTQTWTFVDDCERQIQHVQTITVTPAPQAVFEAVSPLSITYAEAVAFEASNLGYSNQGTGGCLIQGQVMGTLTPDFDECGGTITQSWRYTDDCERTITQTQLITVNSSSQAEFTNPPADTQISCDAAATFEASSLSYTNSDGSISGSVMGTIISSFTECGGTLTQTWTFVDDCERTITHTQTILVVDDTKPEFTFVPENITSASCSEVPAFGTPVVIDNCDTEVTVTFEDSRVNGDCDNSYTLTRTWTATDNCGNSETAQQTIHVIDETAPVISTSAGSLDRNISCSDGDALAMALALVPAATDNCSSEVTISLASDETVYSLTCASGYTRTRTWTFTDECNNISEVFTQVITVTDETAPVISTLAGALDMTFSCSDDDALAMALALVPAATDNCSSEVSISLASDETVYSLTCVNGYTRTRTWTFTDECNNTSEVFTQVITVTDETTPVISTLVGSLDKTISCSDEDALAMALALSPVATDNCGEVTLNVVSDLKVVSQDCANGYTRTRTWTFTDECGNTSEEFTQVITVIDDVKPVITTIAGSLDRTISCSDENALAEVLLLVPAATDNCDGEVTITLTSDEMVYNQECASGYTRTRTWTFTDACGNVSDEFTQVISVVDNSAPVFTTIEGSLDKTLTCEDEDGIKAALELVPVAVDNCGSVVLNLESDVTTVDQLCSNSYTRVRTWTIADNCGNTDSFTQTITVVDNIAPVFTSVVGSLDRNLECSDVDGLSQALALAPTTFDNCGAVQLTLIEDITTIDELCDNSYTRVRTWELEDGCGNSDTFTQTITVVDNTPPSFTTLEGSLDKTIECSDVDGLEAAMNMLPVVTDNCDLEVSLAYEEQTINGTCENSYSIVRTWTATDNCGNIAKFIQTITVIDETKPVFTFIPESIDGNSCETLPEFGTPVATDNCNGTVIITYEDKTTPGECVNDYTLTRTWTATDACGNISTASQAITVSDNIAPVISTVNGSLDRTVSCSDENEMEQILSIVPEATDNCGGEVIINLVSDETTYNDECSGYIRTRVWNFTDLCSNTSEEFIQKITVIDNTPPEITTLDGALDRTLECSDVEGLTAALELAPVAIDNCGSVDLRLVSDVTTPHETCDNAYTIVRTWMISDNCGNGGETFTQTIFVDDNIRPVLITPTGALDVTLQCSDEEGLSEALAMVPEASDNCTAQPIMFLLSDVITSECENSYTRVRVWHFTDSCGNYTNKFTQTIKVIDNTAPVISTVAGSLDKTIECSDEVSLASALLLIPAATDNCSADLVAELVSDVTTQDENCANGSTRVRTWHFKDECGNCSELFVQTIKIVDTKAPVATAPADITINVENGECDVLVNIEVPEASDDCGEVTIVNNITGTADASGRYQVGTTLITWTVTDECGNETKVETKITVTGGLVAVDDNSSTPLNTPVTIAVLSNDTDCNDNIIPSSVVVTSNPSHGFALVNTTTGEIIYTPESGYTGTDTFVYKVCDEDGLCDEATVTIVIQGAVPILVAVDDEYSLLLNTSKDIANLENDIIPANVTPVITILTQPLHGTLTLNSDMTAVYTPDKDFVGIDTYRYRLSDLNDIARADTAITTINIVPDPSRDTLIIYNAITPNRDGHNDTWVIEGIEEYADNEVLIFNRWGDQVHEFSNYNNTSIVWDGKSKSGNELVNATYYYIIRLRAIKKVYTGWVIIHGQ